MVESRIPSSSTPRFNPNRPIPYQHIPPSRIPLTPLSFSSSYTPTVALPWLNLADAVIHLPHLTERERELAVLATLSRTRAAYAVYAHTRLSLAAGLSEAQVSAALAGQSCASTSSASADALDSLSDSEKAVYEAALAMAGLQGPMGDEEFARIESALGGRERVGAVMHTVASFLYVSVVMNVAGVGVPGEKNL